jgi:acetoin:2,6-dichlorophenolindophenol oxidoreductase subunit beta
MDRQITYAQAISEALDLSMAAAPAVYVMGLGVPDPKGIFGTTLGLQEKHGADRVMDMPCSENAMTGVAIGSALAGMRPVMTHQRVDFALLAMEQLVNQAANWSYMFGGRARVPLVVRMIVGRGWGQGPQHSQSLQAWFAHVPGLKVVMPTTPHDAKGLLIASIQDNNPVIFLEHRWLHNIKGHVPEEPYRVPIGEARIAREGTDLTIVGVSYMTLEALRAAEMLEAEGISAEVVDVRSLKPLDATRIIESVRKTGRLVVADTGWESGGVAGEIVARVTEEAFGCLASAPRRVTLPDCPTPTAPALARHYYPRAVHVTAAAREVLGREPREAELLADTCLPLDVPDPTFTGPF